MTFHSMVLSSYGRRHAGHSPFMLFLMLLKQNWHTCVGFDGKPWVESVTSLEAMPSTEACYQAEPLT